MHDLKLEKNMLLNNKLMKGESDTIPVLIEAMSYFRLKLNDINAVLLKEKIKKHWISTLRKG